MTPSTKYSGVLHTLTAAQADNLDERGIPKQLGRQYRKVALAGYDKDTHTVTMAASSSTPVERYYGQEILSHEKGALRTGRLKDGIALLFNHNMDQHLGKSVSFTQGDPLHITCRFGGNPLALEKEGDVESGILDGVSIGYMVHEWEITEDKNGLRTYLAVDWEIYEVSLVTVPADPTVGVGRSKDDQPVKVRSFRKLDHEAERSADPDDADDDEEDDDPDEQDADRSLPTTTSEPPPQPETQRNQPMSAAADTTVTVDHVAEERARVSALTNLRTIQPAHYTEEQMRSDIASGTQYAVASNALAERVIAAAASTTVRTAANEVLSGMSAREQRQYSRAGAARAAINQLRKGTFNDTESGFALEVSDSIRTAATERGITNIGPGILTPGLTNQRFAQMEAQQRTVTSGSSSIGTATNFTTVELPPIELLRNRAVTMMLGARMIPGLHGTPQFTKQNAAASSSWLAESAAVTSSDPGLTFFTMSPHRLSMASAYTRDFLALSNLAIDGFLAEDRYEVLALSLDYAALAGSGTNNVPQGLLNYTGLPTLLTGSTRNNAGVVTAGAGGTQPTYVDLNNAEALIAGTNADVLGVPRWAGTPQTRAMMRSILKFPGVNGSDALMPDSRVANGLQEGPLGYDAVFSNQLPKNGTVNSVSNLHALVLGIWPQMLIGDWDLNEIIADNITGAASAIYKIFEHGYYDINFRHIEAFVWMWVLAQ